MKAPTVHRKGGHKHNLERQAHHKDTKKYDKQRVRTAENKAKSTKEAKRLNIIADKKRTSRRLWSMPLCWPQVVILDPR